MNTKENQQAQAQLALYIDLLTQADKFCGNNATIIQLTFPHDQDRATQLHDDFLKAFEPFRKHLVEYVVAAIIDLCPDMAEQTVIALTSILDRGQDNGLYTADLTEELQHIIAEENDTADNQETINPK